MQRIEEFEILLSLVDSDEEKLQVQSHLDDFLKRRIPSPPVYDVTAYADFDFPAYVATCSSYLFSHSQRDVSQKQEQERSSTRYSAFEDADHVSPDRNDEGKADSISLRRSKKTRRK